MKKLAAVFDLDGTLLDTLCDLTASVNYAMSLLGLPLHTQDEVRSMVGNGVSVLMQRALPADKRHLHGRALALQRQYYAAHSEHTRPYKGIVPMLQKLRQAGFRIIVNTNKDEDVAYALCRQLLAGLVDEVCGTVVGFPVKPAVVRLAPRIKDFAAMYCGDSDVDVMTAANAGIPCLSVTWGFRSEEYLLSHGAKHIARTPAQAEQAFLRFAKSAE